MQNNNSLTVRTLLISFNLPIWGKEISQWRGAFLEMAGWQEDLCHNHLANDGYHYRYPLVQYRVQRGKASLFAMNEGVEALQRVLSTRDWQLRWQNEPQLLVIEDLDVQEHHLKLLDKKKRFRLRHWMALNAENYQKWLTSETIVQKMMLLQKLLENHVMAAIWGLGYQPAARVEVNLLDVERMKPVMYHNTKLLAFDVVFETNVLLARGMGVGKGISHGFGVVELMKTVPQMPPSKIMPTEQGVTKM